jgi:hypothetical protein
MSRQEEKKTSLYNMKCKRQLDWICQPEYDVKTNDDN